MANTKKPTIAVDTNTNDTTIGEWVQDTLASATATTQSALNDTASFVAGAAKFVAGRQAGDWARAQRKSAAVWAKYL